MVSKLFTHSFKYTVLVLLLSNLNFWKSLNFFFSIYRTGLFLLNLPHRWLMYRVNVFYIFSVTQRKYQEDYENMKDQIYFMQTETPEYEANKRAGLAASKVC